MRSKCFAKKIHTYTCCLDEKHSKDCQGGEGGMERVRRSWGAQAPLGWGGRIGGDGGGPDHTVGKFRLRQTELQGLQMLRCRRGCGMVVLLQHCGVEPVSCRGSGKPALEASCCR